MVVIEELERAQSALAEYLRVSDSAVAFTGAGLSTECGIPDFRSKDSAWRRHPPVPFKDFLADAQARAESLGLAFVPGVEVSGRG